MPLRILEQVRFWKMMEKEHTILIRQACPTLEPEYEKLLSDWEVVFAKTESTAHQAIQHHLYRSHPTMETSKPLQHFVHQANTHSYEFIQHLTKLMDKSRGIKSQQHTTPILNHIIQQSQYYIYVMEQVGKVDDVESLNHEATVNPNPNHLHLSNIPHQPTPENENEAFTSPITNESLWTSYMFDHRNEAVGIGQHTLPPLPYAYDALEPYIDEEIMRLHHDIHHRAYVEGLNTAEKMMEQARITGDYDLIQHWERQAAFHGAGHYLHTIFWNIMSPDGGGEPTQAIGKQIEKDFGSFEAFQTHFSEAAKKVEGSGWAILVWSPRSRRLEILQAEKHQNLTQWDVIPLLVLDVWEHAYYLQYQADRGSYVDAWWNIVNWSHVNERFTKASTLKWQPY